MHSKFAKRYGFAGVSKASSCRAERGKRRWHLRQQMTEGICCKIQSAPKFAAFESPQALRASVPCAQGAPLGRTNSPKISVKNSAFCRADRVDRPYNACMDGARNFELFQITREKSRKTEEVFLVGLRRSGGKSKSLRARFLFATFSFGEAKEKVGQQSQISESVLTLTSASLTTK